ncbi:glycosyltransferase [Methylosinus trichosporium]|uniref:glycosyltransferase n=1 Tax=Methylosinus TaxID=425 RepID=UPI0001D2E4AA|nr:glycosyltransferase [Methylosinus trichosporium]
MLRLLVNERRFFDKTYYLKANPDVAASKANPFKHFMRHGWREGRNPSAAFDCLYYLATRDLSLETNALTHYVDCVWPLSEGLAPSGEDEVVRFQIETVRPHVDASFYRARYGLDEDVDAAEHYLRVGCKLLFDPSPFFSTERHLEAHPFLRSASASPLYHRLALRPDDPASPDASAPAKLASNIERVDSCSIAGWAYDPAAPAEPVVLDVSIDGVHFAQATAEWSRNDLRSLDPRIVGGCFETFLPPGAGAAVVDISRRGASIEGAPLTVELKPHSPRIVSCRRVRRPLAVVVTPIDDSARALKRCLDAVMRHTRASTSLILIDDASADPQIAETLRAFEGLPNIVLRRNDEPVGYAKSVDLGLEIARASDVILLSCDALAGPRWADNLQDAAYSADDIASVTALCDDVGAFAVPDPRRRVPIEPGWTMEDYQRLILQHSSSLLPQTPVADGFCMFLRRDALDELGPFDAGSFVGRHGAEQDWSMRAGRAGWRHLIDDRTLVHRMASADSHDVAPNAEGARTILEARHLDYRALSRRLDVDPRINAVRHGVRRLREEMAAERVATPKPRILFVISTRTGGTPMSNRDLMRGLRDRFEPFLLHCDRRRLTLTKVELDESRDETVERCELDQPIELVDHDSRHYAVTVEDWLARHAIELVHIRHLAWHGLALPKIARRAGIPVIMSFHDYYAVCPSLKLLDETGRYCGGACTPTPGECVPDLWTLQAAPPLKGAWVREWRRKFAEAFAHCDAFVSTSQAATTILEANFPALAGRIDIIEHGRDFPSFHPPRAAPRSGAPADILVPGNLSAEKGRDLVMSLAALDAGRRLRFHLLGEVFPPLQGAGVVSHGAYSREQFAARCLATDATIGAVFSKWPETHCHTLTELWSVGLPVIGLDFGAVAERIRATGAGWVVPLDRVETLYSDICDIVSDGEALARARAAVAAWQENEGAHNTVAAMATKYEALYRRVRAARALGSER